MAKEPVSQHLTRPPIAPEACPPAWACPPGLRDEPEPRGCLREVEAALWCPPKVADFAAFAHLGGGQAAAPQGDRGRRREARSGRGGLHGRRDGGCWDQPLVMLPSYHPLVELEAGGISAA
eukprot:scaffold70781_cov73-Phaeocystis_antarctica.AAC.3